MAFYPAGGGASSAPSDLPVRSPGEPMPWKAVFTSPCFDSAARCGSVSGSWERSFSSPASISTSAAPSGICRPAWRGTPAERSRCGGTSTTCRPGPGCSGRLWFPAVASGSVNWPRNWPACSTPPSPASAPPTAAAPRTCFTRRRGNRRLRGPKHRSTPDESGASHLVTGLHLITIDGC